MGEYQTLDVSIHDDVYRIALDRPKKLNAITSDVFPELERAFRDATDDRSTNVVVLTGNGDAFCAGGDLDGMKARMDEEGREDIEYWIEKFYGHRYIDYILNLHKPLVTRVNGDATGMGGTLATIGDIVIADKDAMIGDPHVRVGFATPSTHAFWPMFTHHHKATELLLTGDLIPASEAQEYGLVNYAVPEDELDAKVNEMVDKLATGPQHAIRLTKILLTKKLKQAAISTEDEGLAFETMTSQLPDHREAITAFLEDRDPHFEEGRDL